MVSYNALTKEGIYFVHSPRLHFIKAVKLQEQELEATAYLKFIVGSKKVNACGQLFFSSLQSSES